MPAGGVREYPDGLIENSGIFGFEDDCDHGFFPFAQGFAREIDLLTQAAKIKQLDKPDPVKPKEITEKPIKVYDLDPSAVGLPSVSRHVLARQIDSMDLPEREKERLRRDANIIDVDIEEMLDDTEEKTKDYE